MQAGLCGLLGRRRRVMLNAMSELSVPARRQVPLATSQATLASKIKTGLQNVMFCRPVVQTRFTMPLRTETFRSAPDAFASGAKIGLSGVTRDGVLVRSVPNYLVQSHPVPGATPTGAAQVCGAQQLPGSAIQGSSWQAIWRHTTLGTQRVFFTITVRGTRLVWQTSRVSQTVRGTQ